MTPKQELMCCLDEDMAEAVVEFRKVTKKAPLTSMGARLLAKRLMEWPGGATEAAEIMIERCWQGFKAEWVTKPNQRTAITRITPQEAARLKLEQEIADEWKKQSDPFGQESLGLQPDTALPLGIEYRRPYH